MHFAPVALNSQPPTYLRRSMMCPCAYNADCIVLPRCATDYEHQPPAESTLNRNEEAERPYASDGTTTTVSQPAVSIGNDTQRGTAGRVVRLTSSMCDSRLVKSVGM